MGGIMPEGECVGVRKKYTMTEEFGASGQSESGVSRVGTSRCLEHLPGGGGSQGWELALYQIFPMKEARLWICIYQRSINPKSFWPTPSLSYSHLVNIYMNKKRVYTFMNKCLLHPTTRHRIGIFNTIKVGVNYLY